MTRYDHKNQHHMWITTPPPKRIRRGRLIICVAGIYMYNNIIRARLSKAMGVCVYVRWEKKGNFSLCLYTHTHIDTHKRAMKVNDRQ
jgi:uridine kinase